MANVDAKVFWLGDDKDFAVAEMNQRDIVDVVRKAEARGTVCLKAREGKQFKIGWIRGINLDNYDIDITIKPKRVKDDVVEEMSAEEVM